MPKHRIVWQFYSKRWDFQVYTHVFKTFIQGSFTMFTAQLRHTFTSWQSRWLAIQERRSVGSSYLRYRLSQGLFLSQHRANIVLGQSHAAWHHRLTMPSKEAQHPSLYNQLSHLAVYTVFRNFTFMWIWMCGVVCVSESMMWQQCGGWSTVVW